MARLVKFETPGEMGRPIYINPEHVVTVMSSALGDGPATEINVLPQHWSYVVKGTVEATVYELERGSA